MSKNILSIKNLRLKSPNSSVYILDNINLTLEEKDFLIILGGNGSGKSSLLKTINKTNKFFKGEIILDGSVPVKTASEKSIAGLTSTITQEINANLFCSMSILENFMLYNMKYNDSQRIDESMLKNHLNKYNSNLSKKINQPVSVLSGGEKQSLILALIFLRPPKLLILDEHTSALAPMTSEKLMKITAEIIKDENITCVMATHSLDFALKFGNKIVALKDGKVIYYAEGKKKQYLTKEELARYCY
jgi:putative ABC transport system ATP-binding protein